jgi:iron complex transport system ATP-binding protein
MLEIKNYNSSILSDISFNIENNLAILGSNGVGKTTLAKVLANIIDNKNVKIDNRYINEIPNNQRVKLINYIPTKLEIYDEHISVKEYLSLSHYDNSIDINEILKTLNISHLENSITKNLSSGEASLVQLASSILHNAKYTILDEPTANLDPNKIQLAYKILKSKEYLQNKILITHNLNLTYKIGFDILFLKDKYIAYQGSNNQFFTQDNLDNFFGSSVKKIDNNIVVNL